MSIANIFDSKIKSMQNVVDTVLLDREHAGRLLGEKLASYKESNAIVAGIPNGGVVVAAVIAEVLSLPLTVWPCRRIYDPTDNSRSIGSVCANDIFIRYCSRTIPQDYIYHQIAMLRSAIQNDQKEYYGNCDRNSFLGKTVILVDDLVDSGDSIMACIRGIRKMAPAMVVVAVPVVTPEAVRNVRMHADYVVFLHLDPVIISGNDFFGDFRRIENEEVRELLDRSSIFVKLD